MSIDDAPLSPLSCEFCGKDMGFCELPKDKVPAAFCRERCVEGMRSGEPLPTRRERKRTKASKRKP